MLKSAEFEHGVDYTTTDKRFDTLQFAKDSNDHFVYESMEALLGTEAGKATLSQMIQTFFGSQKERLSILDDYSKGRNYTILSGRRRIEKDKADYRIAHNWGGYISNHVTGYLMSKPITIGTQQADDDESQSLAVIEQINRDNEIDSLNFELGFDASRFGRAFELHYRDEEGDRIVLVDPQDIFIVRSTDVSKKMIGAVHVPVYNKMVHMTIYTDSHKIAYQPYTLGTVGFVEQENKPHLYHMVPVVEWWNDRFRQGDFETVIPQMDAYDSAQSDTANYMSDLNDALLVLSGDLQAAGIGSKEAAQMKEANILLLESGTDHSGKQTSISAGYIYKQYDVAGSEAYKTRIINDIYKLSNVPNLDDDRFYSGQSGIALQYKMIGLEQIRSIKESFFTKALRRRYQLIEGIHEELSAENITAKDLTFTFHENIPQDIWAEVEKYVTVGGDVSATTLMELASFIESPEDELQRMLNESINPNTTDEERSFLLGRDLDVEP